VDWCMTKTQDQVQKYLEVMAWFLEMKYCRPRVQQCMTRTEVIQLNFHDSLQDTHCNFS
jgi:hypothetical protein